MHNRELCAHNIWEIILFGVGFLSRVKSPRLVVAPGLFYLNLKKSGFYRWPNFSNSCLPKLKARHKDSWLLAKV